MRLIQNRRLPKRAARRLAPELLLLESRELLSPFTVTNTADSGPGSLRQAITDADAAGDGSVIDFQIPGTGVQTIAPVTDLPAISAGITIDGTTQPGASANTNPIDHADNAVLLIELSGANDSSGIGLQITGNGATVRGLVIDRWSRYRGGLEISGQNATVAGDFIGSDPTGLTRAANSSGIYIDSGAANLTIGGTSPADRNVIAGNSTDISSAGAFTGVDNLKLVGNFIGVDAAGDAILDPPTELDYGARIDAQGTNLTIGGTTLAERNVIDSGLEIDNRTGVLVQGNFFDTDITGTTRVAVDLAVVYSEASSGVTVGGTAAGAANVFATGFSVPNGSQAAETGLVVQGNFFGTDPTGTIALGTGGGAGGAPWGIDLGNAVDPIVGGTNPGEGNTIANVQGYGILSQAERGQILGNSIYANTLDGLYIEDEDAGHVTAANAPHLTAATSTEIDGSYTAGPGTYRVEFFSSPVQPAGSPLAASDELQGKTLLGFEDVTVGADGVANFTFSPSSPISGDVWITSTATPTVINPNYYLSTVGFSNAIRLAAAPATSSDVSVSMSVSPNPVRPGGVLLYSIIVTNNGPDIASALSFSDTLPDGTTFQSFTAPDGWTTSAPAAGATGTVTASLSSLATGGTATFSLVLQVDSRAANGSTIANTAAIATTTTDPDSSNNTAGKSVTVAAAEVDVPTQTSLASSLNPAKFGESVSFTALVAASASGGTPTGFITFTVDGQSEPAVAVSSQSGGVGSSFTPGQLSIGSHRITATYLGDSTFESSVSNTVVEVVNSAPVTSTGPVVTRVERFGFHAMPTTIVVLFDRALDSSAAELIKNYRIKGPGGRTIPIKSVKYDAASHSVSLHPAVRLSLHWPYSLWINGSSATGLRDLTETLLDGAHSGRSGTDYTTALTGKLLVLSGSAAAARAKPAANPSSASRHGK